MAQHDEMEPLMPPTEANHAKPLIEIGLLVAQRLDADVRQGIEEAQRKLLDLLAEMFSEFEWRIYLVRCRECEEDKPSEEPVQLLQRASEQREAREWDFALLITSLDLVSHYKPFSFAVVSRALDLAVVSTARIDPGAGDPLVAQDRRIAVLSERLQAITLHLLGHLNGLTHDGAPDNVMFDIQTLEDLTRMRQLRHEQLQALAANLRKTADLRLEETENVERSLLPSFYLRGAWINRHEIFDAVWQAKPWQFPIRLPKLTTAAASALMALMLTAETWDLALNQTPLRVASLFLAALLATTFYVAVRQHLFVQRKRRRVSEQTVIANVSAVTIVLAGMVTTGLLLFSVSLAAALSLYRVSMVRGWAASVAVDITLGHYLLMAAFVTSLGILIGSLGASFEDQHHFRHIIFVDEET